MQKPSESLDDFVVKAQEINTEPPRLVSVRFTGEVEVLKPLERAEPLVKPDSAGVDTDFHPAPDQLSWFHRSLVAGGAFALGAVILASAIFVGMYDGAVQQVAEVTEVAELATGVQRDDGPLPAEGPLTSEIFTTASSETTNANSDTSSELRDPHSTSGIRKFPRSAFRSSARLPRVRFAAYAPQPSRSELGVSEFVPTTLVIYIDNGEIKTRVEPQLTGYNKPLTLSN